MMKDLVTRIFHLDANLEMTATETIRDTFTSSLYDYLKEKINKLEENSTNCLFYSLLLVDNDELTTAEFQSFLDDIGSKSNYPSYPLYRTLSSALLQYVTDNEDQNQSKHLENVCEISVEFNEEFHSIAKEIKEQFLKDSERYVALNSNIDCFLCKSNTLFSCLDKPHILKLLGMSKTVGTLEILPPKLHALWESFNQQHHPKSKLTVAARALSKHCHRSSDIWWGECTGTEADKNKKAIEVFKRIFNDICWLNIHTLPHDVFVLEVRCSDWYGLRWSSDGQTFRGFLEPQMIDGHEKNWRH